ncbi:MAG: OmpA family protein, partial [Rhodobacterales bacterium]|nr:OmpA family protein [Rhodobacterales bacterium]
RCVDSAEDLDGYDDKDGCPDPDNDDDGVPDIDDQCKEAEDIDGWQDEDGCPDPDNDDDGVLDNDDTCPTDAGTAETNGCPDADGDGVGDNTDRCPDLAGPVKTMGCPDRDSDDVADLDDACPDDPKPNSEPVGSSDGCPKDVYVAEQGIEFDQFNQNIVFGTGQATIQSESFTLLATVAKLIIEHPEMGKVEIQGHTDNVGGAENNLALSQKRAEAVMKYLTGEGVQAERVTAKGFGQTKPIDSNRSPKGRANNRRVAFIIQSKAKPSGTGKALPKVATDRDLAGEPV